MPKEIRAHGPIATPFDQCPGCIDLIALSLQPAALETQAKCSYLRSDAYQSHVNGTSRCRHSLGMIFACSCGALMFSASRENLPKVGLMISAITQRLEQRVEPQRKVRADTVRPEYRQEVTEWDLP